MKQETLKLKKKIMKTHRWSSQRQRPDSTGTIDTSQQGPLRIQSTTQGMILPIELFVFLLNVQHITFENKHLTLNHTVQGMQLRNVPLTPRISFRIVCNIGSLNGQLDRQPHRVVVLLLEVYECMFQQRRRLSWSICPLKHSLY